VLEQGTDKLGVIGHGWTYSAHPIGAAAGIANLKLIDELGLVENAGKVGGYLNARMTEALGDHKNVGDVRGEGMLCAVELVEDKASRAFFDPGKTVAAKVVAGMVRRGVIARAMPEGDIIGFAPPLCLTAR
jgi:L-2,4-diaminobutyrate transaminase